MCRCSTSPRRSPRSTASSTASGARMKLFDPGHSRMVIYSGYLRNQLNLAAESIDTPHEAPNDLAAVAAGEVSGTEIFVLNAVFQHVIGGSEHGGCDSQDGFLGPAPRAQAVELGLQVRVLGAHCRPSGADQGGRHEPMG